MYPLQLRPAGIHNPEEYSFTTERLEEAAAQKRAHDPKAKGDSTRSAYSTCVRTYNADSTVLLEPACEAHSSMAGAGKVAP